jgi:hypothetical protein
LLSLKNDILSDVLVSNSGFKSITSPAIRFLLLLVLAKHRMVILVFLKTAFVAGVTFNLFLQNRRIIELFNDLIFLLEAYFFAMKRKFLMDLVSVLLKLVCTV